MYLVGVVYNFCLSFLGQTGGYHRHNGYQRRSTNRGGWVHAYVLDTFCVDLMTSILSIVLWNIIICLFQGTYTTTINYTQLTSLFIGPKFFYGNFLVKTLFLSMKGNIFCSISNVKFRKLEWICYLTQFSGFILFCLCSTVR